MIEFNVDLGERSYPVVVGSRARHRLGELLPAGARRVAIITQENIAVTVDPGVESQTIIIPDGEGAKNLATVESICRTLAIAGFTRNDLIVGIGGGVVTDLAGFAAAVYHRGIRFVTVPTTLLGQIDAAIGGKTGVNLPEGKNLVGAFWQPSLVLCDTETLDSLPEREFRSGMGELAKYHFLTGEELDGLPLDERIAACIRIKADVVASDEREQGRRAILNYGHTLAHALETLGGYDLRHGEAVAIGLVYAAELACLLGRIGTERVEEHRRVIASYDLSASLPSAVDEERVVELFARDKKALDGITFVLDGADGVELVTGIERSVLVDALALMNHDRHGAR
ncbi:MAG: 3-dehydroquinate synthase family protein [Acidimicrobiales bacterium]